MPKTRLAGLLAGLLLACPPSAWSARGGPDEAGYEWYDNASGCSTNRGSFGAGAMAFLGESRNMVGPFDLGFTMPFLGQAVTQAWVSPHGYVSFSAQPNVGPPQRLPDPTAPNDLIAAHWLNADDADITVEAQGDVFHVRWLQRAGGFQEFDVDLFLNRDGSFRMFWSSAFSAARVVGYENADGSLGHTYYEHDGTMEVIRDGGNFPIPFGNLSACFDPPTLLDCSSPLTLACGESVAGSLPASALANAFTYACAPEVYTGNEQVVDLTVSATSAVVVEATGPADMDLFRLSGGCDEANCIGRAPTGTDSLDMGLVFPGSYRFVVDKLSSGGGDAFTVTATCTDPFRDLPCDTPLAGDATGRGAFRDTYDCAGPTLDGPEEMYRFTLAAPATIAVTLDTLEPDLWVVLYDAADFEATMGANCLSAGRGGAGLFSAPAGDYLVVVDGENRAAAPYEITLGCSEALDCAGATTVTCTEQILGDNSSSPNGASIYNCLPEVLGGGEDVYRFFNPIEQTITASFVSSQPGQRLLLMPACDQGSCFLAGDEGVSCSLFPPGEYFLVVDSPPSSEGPYEIEILCSEFLSGVDLRVTSIDASAVGAGCESFDVDGDVTLALTNLGTGSAAAPFDVLVFEDGIGSADGLWDPGADTLLGTLSVVADLGPGETTFVDVPVSGTLLFRDNVIHALVDSGGVVAEVSEANNYFDTGRACEYRPPVGAFSPEVEWEWNSSTVMPDYTEVDTVPLVGDVNRDGLPDIVINTAPSGGNRTPAIVRALHGDGSGELWNATDPAARVWGRSQLAMADLDGDPGLEIVGQAGDNGNFLVAIDDDGSFLWRSAQFAEMNLNPYDFGGGGPSIADLDCDGSPEIIFGCEVFNADGSLFWIPEPGGRWGRNEGTFGPDCPLSIVLDVDGDGQQEVVAGPTAYKWNPVTGMGEILWDNIDVADGHAAAGNFDGDDLPEIAIMSRGTMFLLEGDTGAIIWRRDVPIAQSISGGPPTVADFDGDCAAEVGTAASSAYYVFETDGTVKWGSPINDTSSHRTASSVFDFDGDGSAEVAFQDQHLLHVFRGTDGFEIITLPASNHTWIEMISIADVDADNNAEIVQPLNRGGGSPTPLSGIRVVGDADDNWVNTRRIWNQHQYHVSNINDDGTVPGPAEGCERPSWREHNTYRDQIGSAQYSAADITISIIETEVIPNALCFADLRVVARVGNGGAINVGASFPASFYDGDPAAGGTLLHSEPIPDIGPGEFGDFEVVIPLPRVGDIELWAVADDDGSGMGTGTTNECREDNNSCVTLVTNDFGGAGDPPGPVGPALRAGDHGDPHAADITAIFDWSLDAGAPRPAGVHFHVYRASDPTALVRVSPDPWDGPTWDDSTPAAGALPFVHFYKVFAADPCEQEELR